MNSYIPLHINSKAILKFKRPYTCVYRNRPPASNYKAVVCSGRNFVSVTLTNSIQPNLDSCKNSSYPTKRATFSYQKCISRRVAIVHGIVPTVGKHIVGKQPCACGGIAVRVDKPGNHRVIVAALQVVETCLHVVIIPTVPQGVDVRQAAAGGNEFTPGVVLIGGQHIAIDILNAGDVTLLGGHIVASHIGAGCRMIPESNRGALIIVEEEQLIAIPLLPNQPVPGVGVMVLGHYVRKEPSPPCHDYSGKAWPNQFIQYTFSFGTSIAWQTTVKKSPEMNSIMHSR